MFHNTLNLPLWPFFSNIRPPVVCGFEPWINEGLVDVKITAQRLHDTSDQGLVKYLPAEIHDPDTGR